MTSFTNNPIQGTRVSFNDLTIEQKISILKLAETLYNEIDFNDYTDAVISYAHEKAENQELADEKVFSVYMHYKTFAESIRKNI